MAAILSRGRWVKEVDEMKTEYMMHVFIFGGYVNQIEVNLYPVCLFAFRMKIEKIPLPDPIVIMQKHFR